MTYDRRVFDKHGGVFRHHIECCRWQNLIYVRTLKCASEFFWRNFTETAGWQPMDWYDIDWTQHKVFSYIMDPLLRRHKGIAEWLVINNLTQALDDDAVRSIITAVPWLDAHSASLDLIYGERMQDITWLPISQDHVVAVQATDSWLCIHGHPVIAWNYDHRHDTDGYMKRTYLAVRDLWDSMEIQRIHAQHFQKDIAKWQQVCQGYGITS